ncbi:MAG TPA: hypothetical protein VNT26_03375 [Candidatus Sulfotelmatobacter sp.]|nr:hypothetical protein [Candidatus Sulfotelmatobacter sp.]
MFPTTWPRPAETAARTGTYLHAGMTRGYISVSPAPPAADNNLPQFALEFTALGMTHSGGTWPTLADAMREAERICPGIQWDRS